MASVTRSRSLQVFVDGKALPDDEARAFWARFSSYMDEHHGDLAGFAKSESFASVHPEMRSGGAALVVSTTAAQRPYTNVSGADGDDGGGANRGGGGHGAGRPAQGKSAKPGGSERFAGSRQEDRGSKGNRGPAPASGGSGTGRTAPGKKTH